MCEILPKATVDGRMSTRSDHQKQGSEVMGTFVLMGRTAVIDVLRDDGT